MKNPLFFITRLGTTKPKQVRAINREALQTLALMLGAHEAAQYLVWSIITLPKTYGVSEICPKCPELGEGYTLYEGYTCGESLGDLYNYCR